MKCWGRVSSVWIAHLKIQVPPGVGEDSGPANASGGALLAEGETGAKALRQGGSGL